MYKLSAWFAYISGVSIRNHPLAKNMHKLNFYLVLVKGAVKSNGGAYHPRHFPPGGGNGKIRDMKDGGECQRMKVK